MLKTVVLLNIFVESVIHLIIRKGTVFILKWNLLTQFDQFNVFLSKKNKKKRTTQTFEW